MCAAPSAALKPAGAAFLDTARDLLATGLRIERAFGGSAAPR